MRHVVLLDQRQCLLGIEVLHRDHRAAEPHGAHRIEQRRGVVERRGREVDGVRVHPPDGRHHPHLDRLLPDRGAGALVPHAFRSPRGPRRIQHPRPLELLVEWKSRIPVARLVVRLVTGNGILADHQANLHPRHLVDELRGDIVKRVADDEHLRVAIVEDVRDLVRVEVRVDAGEIQPGSLRGPARLEVLDPVLHQHRDVIAEAQPRVPEQLRELIGTIVQLRVGDNFSASCHHVRRMSGPLQGVLTGPHARQRKRWGARCTPR